MTILLNFSEETFLDAQDDLGQTALHYAVLNSDYEMVHLLLRVGADFGLTNNQGRKPVEIAKVSTIANLFRGIIFNSSHIMCRAYKNTVLNCSNGFCC